VENNKLKDQI